MQTRQLFPPQATGEPSVGLLSLWDCDQQPMMCMSSLQIFWSDSGELVCIATEESFFILKYLSEKVAASQESNEGVTEDGIEDAFEVGGSLVFSAGLCAGWAGLWY